MGDAGDSQNDDKAMELDIMLALANRELTFLRDHFAARPEVAETTTGEEFLETLEVALIALGRLRFENEGSNRVDDSAVQSAIAFMKRETS
jgi:hypothetical protein